MRIVVVDPSRTVLKAVSKLLESDRHTVTAFVDAGEALDFIKSNREVNVLITSVELTPMSGIELCRQTRRRRQDFTANQPPNGQKQAEGDARARPSLARERRCDANTACSH